MKILVTGGSGFIGSHLVDKLSKLGHEVNNFDIKKGDDIKDKKSVERACKNKDIIFHLASKLGTRKLFDNQIEAVEVNVIGTLNILNSSLKNNCKLIIATLPDANWLNMYKITKESAEKYCLMYQKYFNLDIALLRVYNVYGPRQSLEQEKAIPTFITKALNNEPIIIYGDGHQSSDYIYVSDVVDAMVAVLKNNGFNKGIIDIGTGKAISVNTIAETIIKLTKSSSIKKYIPMRKGEEKINIAANTKRAEDLLDFKADTSLEEGLKKTIEYYKKLK